MERAKRSVAVEVTIDGCTHWEIVNLIRSPDHQYYKDVWRVMRFQEWASGPAISVVENMLADLSLEEQEKILDGLYQEQVRKAFPLPY